MPTTTKIRRAQAPPSRYHTPNPVIAVYDRTVRAGYLIRHGQSYVAPSADDAFLDTLRTYTDALRAVPVVAVGSHKRRPHLRNRAPPAGGGREEQNAAKQMKWAAACA
jgi:hypothetical protein